MKAIGFQYKKDKKTAAFVEFEQQTPEPKGHDLLVKIEAVSVNPVDYKVRQKIEYSENPPRILGWDAASIVESVGEKVSLFKKGDRVFYAGDITRNGSNASHQLVDEHIVGRMPKSLDFPAAAALPLTSITAWEALFDRLKIDPAVNRDKQILIIGGAGGVGSIAIQLSKKIAHLQVIATASREDSRKWCLSLGADYVINHHDNMIVQFQQQALANPDYILCLNSTDDHFKSMSDLIAPQGMICSIVETTQSHDLNELKSKSAGFVWEFMFTRSMYKTADRIKQHELLNSIADLIDSGEIKTTLKEVFGPMSTENIMKAHKQLEAGSSIGKIVLTQMDSSGK
jgi:NADPH:quinone reductase